MNKLTASCIALVFLLSGCTFSFEVLTPAPVATDVQLTPYSTALPPTPVSTISPTPVPIPATLAPPTTAPIFFNGRAAATPDAVSHLTSFGPGTKRVYVIWDYQNMREGMMVRREWYLNNQPWLTREEPWDFAKYGATGTMRDVSIYDEVAGLDNGSYFLRIYIDNVVQPLGSMINEPIDEWVNFDIGANEQETFMGYGSNDGQWGVEVYGGKRIMLKNVINGETRQIVIVQEVPYVSWFNDSKHFLFVDRDRSEQISGTTIGIRDHLWIVDVLTGEARRIFRGDKAFLGTWGPMPSPNGKYIAGIFGSGFGDACVVDQQMIFFSITPDFQSATYRYQQDFTGMPSFDGGWIYPRQEGYWENDSTFRVTLEGTCNADQSKLGIFRFDPLNKTASQMGFDLAPGDLGFGVIHGKVTDINGVPIPNAVVTCEHSSYSGGALCSGSLTTNVDGLYKFLNIFFHDTDTIKLIVRAPGYESQELIGSAFTVNDWEVNVMLNRVP